ncbi:hypothetical protein [Helicobacter sp. MIT 14-3879]|uniref:hypothetical protein n=1 Tax=Helicobacter sp. MIT 14-3879 TaxID=2040649 RepID=UPI000E1F4312|nr:hypothetical protein [Helicobacter sp. MIT 14-3879]RDU61216.1 hypothetical protein CQA44_09730 [Helicobacter sp. MIT 14-3879]
MLNKNLVDSFLKFGIAVGTVSLLVACSSKNDTRSSGGSKSKVSYSRESEVTVDAAREITITKVAPYIKMPQLPAYEPKKLNEEARGIAVAYSVPYTCKLLGEVEGKDNSDGKVPPSFEDIREGATNDLRNKASELVNEDSRILVKLTKEAMICEMRVKDGQYEEKDCTAWQKIPQNGKILSYRVHANVFECGTK